MKSFLVRTLDNRILGPFSKEQVIEHIQQGALKPRDELCIANEYWFYVQEREETLKFLGIEMPTHRDPEDDITQTETITATNPAEVLKAASSETLAAAQAGGGIHHSHPNVLDSLTATERPELKSNSDAEIKIEFPFFFKLSVWTVFAILLWMGFQIYRQIHPDYSYPPVSLPSSSPALSPVASSAPSASPSPVASPSAAQ